MKYLNLLTILLPMVIDLISDIEDIIQTYHELKGEGK